MPLHQPIEANDLNPVIITSPQTRCGTTLIQRLLCSSDNGIAFGEQLCVDLQVLHDLFINRHSFFYPCREDHRNQLAEVCRGNTDFWMPNLMPDIDGYLNALVNTYKEVMVPFQNHARQLNRPVWGAKVPTWPAERLEFLLTLLPQARVIYIYRNVFDCAKSAKSRKFIGSEDSIHAYAATWAQNVAQVSALIGSHNILAIEYERLLAEPVLTVETISAVTGATNIDPKILGSSGNTWTGQESNGHAPDGYIAPSDLTARERRIISQAAGAVMAELYPEITQESA